MLKSGAFVPCGRCPRCRKNRQREWTFRLKAERDVSDFTLWLTLTIAPDYMDYAGDVAVLSKDKPRHFLEALRLKYRNRIRFKHFVASEYGDHTDRPHFHALLFGKLTQSHTLGDVVRLKNDVTQFICGEKSTAWPYGFVLCKPVHANVFAYITNYINKPELLDPEHPHPVRPFTCISQGIGIDFMHRFNQSQFDGLNFVVNHDGKKQVLPRYYRDKFFPHSRREMERALMAGDFDRFSEISKNSFDLTRNAYMAGTQRVKKLLSKERDFDRTHSITFDEYLRNASAEEERQYNNMLLKRKAL